MGIRAALQSVTATSDEIDDPRPGDGLVPNADSVMNRAFTVAASPDVVWPWLVQLGKGRAGWYLPRTVERIVPPPRRAARSLLPRWQGLMPGDVVPDYGGPHATFEAVTVEPPRVLVYRSQRGAIRISWSIVLTDSTEATGGPPSTRVHLRLRLGPIRRRWLVNTAGELIDLLTIAGMAAGLAERTAP